MAARLGGTTAEPILFEMWARNPMAWLDSAQTLRRAARAVWVEIVADANELRNLRPLAPGAKRRPQKRKAVAIESPWYLLLALMLENVFKGLLVAKKPERVSAKGLGDVKGHDLVKLAQLGGLKLSADEKAFIEFLSAATLSFGRYPVATNAAGTHTKREADLDGTHRLAEELFARAVDPLLRKACKGGTSVNDHAVSVDEIICWHVNGYWPHEQKT